MRNSLIAWLWVWLLTLGACGKGGDGGGQPGAPGQGSNIPTPGQVRFSLPRGVSRIVAVGDLHGDIMAARSVLRLSKLIDQRDTWIGGRSVLVQTGDLLDRGGTELAMIRLFDTLRTKAAAAGGRVYLLLGNHEMLNFRGDFRYVTKEGFREFAPFAKDRDVLARLTAAQRALVAATPGAIRGRRIAFFPGGPLSTYYSDSPVILKLGSVVFVHGGLLSRHVKHGIARLNRSAADFIGGKKPIAKELTGKHAPTWVRRWSRNPGRRRCEELRGVLSGADATVMVVGHTIQRKGITSACGGRVWRIDTAMAAHYGSNPGSALQITQDGITVLR